ncbi:MAG TPA: hypothetical protein VF796_27910 [Humisphaera sp.]
MHIAIGMLGIVMARALLAVYLLIRFDFIGRRVVRLCCLAHLAGAGIDDAAVEVIREMHDDGGRLLEEEVARVGTHSLAAHILSKLRLMDDQ